MKSQTNQISSIADAIKKLKKMEQSYHPFREITQQLWQAQMSQIFDFYISEVERCFTLVIRKNLTSNNTYIVEINHLKRFSLEIVAPDRSKTLFQDASHIGIIMMKNEMKRECVNWDTYACRRLAGCLRELKDYFYHIEKEQLVPVINIEKMDDHPF